MASRFTANIHSIGIERKMCVVTIMDGSEYIINKKNIGLELNPDGTANTEWIKAEIKMHTNRRLTAPKSLATAIPVTIGNKKES